MKSLSYIEIDIPVCSLSYGIAPCMAAGGPKCFNTIKTCQDRENFDEDEVTLRFAKDAAYLPSDIDCIPSVSDISFAPGSISLGENLGTRSTLTVTFNDHPHTDTGEGYDKYRTERAYNPVERGTFWGKFRARQPFLRGRSLRWITGLEGQSIEEMEIRHYLIESTDGPQGGKFSIIAKDPGKLLDGDRSQAPIMNTGFLAAPIANNATSLTLSPVGVGDAEYALDGYVTIAGKEVCAFTRWKWDAYRNDHFTRVMLHFDGANGSAVFTDDNAAGINNVWTASGSQVLTTASKKFGSASLNSGALTGGISTPAKAALDVGTDDFTIDFFWNNNGSSDTHWAALAGYGNSSVSNAAWSWLIERHNSGVLYFSISSGSSVSFTGGTTNLNTGNVWHHIAIVRSAGVIRGYVDGIQEFSFAFASAPPASAGPLKVHSGVSNSGVQGSLIDEFRYDIGIARWTANFTPPAAPYATGDNKLSTGDVVTLTARGQFNTVAAAGAAQDRVQQVLRYVSVDVADIVYDLMVNYAEVPAEWINLAEWKAETAAFLAQLYSAVICEPTSVATLVSELILQGCLVLWWDDSAQKFRLQVLRAIVTDAARFSADNIIAGTFSTKEQPDKRISRVQTYFGPINPVRPLTDADNYRSSSLIVDEDAEDDYGGAVIKKVFSRWIPALGRAVADRFGVIQLARFRDPPRRITFDLSRYAETDVRLGGGYRVAAHSFQDATGALVDVPVQVTRLNAPADRFKVEAEEVLFAVPVQDLNIRNVIIDSNQTNVNLRSAHDASYPAAVAGNTIVCTIRAGVRVTSLSRLLPALDVGSWPAGVIIKLVVDGVIQGAGGVGGLGYQPGMGGGAPGLSGGAALYTRYAIELKLSASSRLWGGGGGGGGGGAVDLNRYAGGGGGGAGDLPGVGGVGAIGNGGTGTDTAGGAGGAPWSGAYPGGVGGGPGQAGVAGGSYNAPGGAGGAAGAQIDGNSFVTIALNLGDRRGPTIN